MIFSASFWRGLRWLARPLQIVAALGLVCSAPAWAHVGSPDIYADGNAGPYRLFVTVRPPLVIPGVAEIEVRANAASANGALVSRIEIAPIPLTGEASLHPPVADAMNARGSEKNSRAAGSGK